MCLNKFENSKSPQFLKTSTSCSLLRYFIKNIVPEKKIEADQIYIRREDANYRKVLNEADLIEKLRNQGFEVINPHHYEILDQMKIFSSAEVIISPHGSNLSNIIFCNKGAKIIEISPPFKNPYEKNISARYQNLSKNMSLEFTKIISDTVNVDNHSDLAKKYINNNILNENDYYKNMILKVSKIDNIINSL